MKLLRTSRITRVPLSNWSNAFKTSAEIATGDFSFDIPSFSSEPSVKEKLASELSPYVTGELAFERQKELMDRANAFSAEQAEIARRHNLYTSSTQYQRAVKDLRKAGLNPYLAYSAGGASVSSSPSPSSSAGGTAPSDKVIETLLGSAELLATVAKLVRSKK